jgi:orotidine-5'-phosphate decarboxylase
MKVQQSFNERLNMLISNKSSLLCIGLDPVVEKIPSHLKYEKNPLMLFNREIVEATCDMAVAYKANLAFYESEGQNGLEALYDLKSMISNDVLLILDGKRGDVPHTADKYAHAYFQQQGADAVTLFPYMGEDSIRPFVKKPEKGAFILALTSNEGVQDFQYLQVGVDPFYLLVGKKVNSWNTNNNCGLVVGAKDIEGLKILRNALPDLPFLVPGVGAQGGDLKEVVKFGRNKAGTGLLVNVGRDIIYADNGKNFSQKIKEKAKSYVEEMSSLMKTTWNYY